MISGKLVGELLERKIPIAGLVAALGVYFGISQILLWRFLGFSVSGVYFLGLVVLALICAGIVRAIIVLNASRPTPRDHAPTLKTFLISLLLAIALFALGGEGRFFYSNIDWQVRDAVLRDLAINPWPFVYQIDGGPSMLRAPIGFFLMPATVWKFWGQRAAEILMLSQSATVLAVLLTIGSQLFNNFIKRAIALVTFLCFSGLDIVGHWLVSRGPVDHIEAWTGGLQYSATITQAFWVPHHALAGWTGALLFLSHRRQIIPLSAFLAIIPLTALWSPLAMIGTLPFAALAGLTAMKRGKISVDDIVLPALSSLIALPAIIYLGSANGDVEKQFLAVNIWAYIFIELLEVFVFLAVIIPTAMAMKRDRDIVLIVTITLVLLPLLQIGPSVDFMMRASIPTIAILSFLVAGILTEQLTKFSPPALWLGLLLGLGCVTGFKEVARALRYPPSPHNECSLVKTWDVSFARFPIGIYLAPLDSMAVVVRPATPVHFKPKDPQICWKGDWYRPSGV